MVLLCVRRISGFPTVSPSSEQRLVKERGKPDDIQVEERRGEESTVV